MVYIVGSDMSDIRQRLAMRQVLAMAEGRAIEEQEERENPLDGRGSGGFSIYHDIGKKANIFGRGEEMEGGAWLGKDGKVHTVNDLYPNRQRRYGSQRKGMSRQDDSKMEGSGILDVLSVIPRLILGGGKKQSKKDEMEEMGASMASHIQSLHGAGGFQDFANGFKRGFLGVVKPALAIASVLPGQAGIIGKVGTIGLNLLGAGKSPIKGVRKATLNAMANGKPHHFTAKELETLHLAGLVKDVSKFKRGFTGVLSGSGDAEDHVIAGRGLKVPSASTSSGTTVYDVLAPVLTAAGVYFLNRLIDHYTAPKKEEKKEEKVIERVIERPVGRPYYRRPRYRGYGMAVEAEDSSDSDQSASDMEGGSGAYDGLGKRAKRGPLSASDPRKRRAALVKKVMSEKGLSMIKASSYIKQHGLKY